MRDNYTDSVASLLDAMTANGIEPANPDALLSNLSDGTLKRFPTASKRRKRNGWIVLHHYRQLPAIAIAGDWSTGAELKWTAHQQDTLTDSERRQLQQQMEQAKAQRKAEQARQWDERAARALTDWYQAQPAEPNHPYLQKKGIQPHNARQQGRDLVLLLTDFNGKAWSLQTIDGAGNKRLMAGGRKADNFIVVNHCPYPSRVLVCEGWATGCTLAESYGDALVLAAVDAGNLQAVTTGARNRWPDADLIVCGDDDRKTPGNPGATAARAAALAAGARFALPEWPPTAPLHLSDFNDLAAWRQGAA